MTIETLVTAGLTTEEAENFIEQWDALRRPLHTPNTIEKR